MYSVTAASRMSGVHPATLRAWERRYEVIQPRRDSRGRRVYAAEDVDRLRLLRRGTELGHPISRLAPLSLEELLRVIEQCPAAEESAPGERSRLVRRLLDAARRYRDDECDEVLGLAATLLDPEALIRDVVTPAMRAAGARWHRGELSVAQERLLTSSARRTLTSLLGTYRRRASGPRMVLATLPGEHHELGLLVTALVAACEGLDCVYLGPDIPVPDMVDAVTATGAICVGLSCVTRVPQCDLVGALTDLCRRLPEQCNVWLGGCSATEVDRAALPTRCKCLSTHGDLREHARALLSA